jgi:hypothetical protein
MPDDIDALTPIAGNVRPTEIIEGDWAKLQKAVDRSSARRHGQLTGPVSESDEETGRADTIPVEETEKTIIQPGMPPENRPIRRVSLRRLRGDVDAESIDQPLDEDEL